MSVLPRFARFWMVCRKPTGPRSRSEPKARFSSLGDARNTAATLAEEADAPFLILETVEVIHPGDLAPQRSLI
ncbi:hypothetical protein FHY55_19355 [Oceanicola sp. D3]|uniref:hypothetical protein n=1 Tax=Oceanicola sp. D3 TaxID=2587163 RepID=UPI0011219D1E|nr:hypothetical protein [Oceanicola sp. D3]QDC11256.1 hypothetical protein FHY55_19355 [Oceanicola sp. D3]